MTMNVALAGGRSGLLRALAGFACIGLLTTASAEAQTLSDEERTFVVTRAAEMIESRYAAPEIGRSAADALRNGLGQRRLRDAATAPELAAAMTDILNPFDTHFAVSWAPEPTGPSGAELPAPSQRASNYGFEEYRLLSGNVAYLNLAVFANFDEADPQDPARRAAEAAMAMLANADAVIVDLRECGGGTPEMEQLVASYFFDDEPRLLSRLYWGPDGRTYEYRTLERLVGARMPDKPLFVVTSARTASAAEAFAYDMQAFHRATIVGERTAGGANPGSTFSIGRGFSIFISVGLVTNAVTGSNWEGVGVSPEIEANYETAVRVAHRAALETLLRAEPVDAARLAIEWTLERMSAEDTPDPLSARERNAFVGIYGTRVVVRDGAELYYRQTERRPRRRLIRIAGDRFALEGFDRTRIEFERDARGQVVALSERATSGRAGRHAKQ